MYKIIWLGFLIFTSTFIKAQFIINPNNKATCFSLVEHAEYLEDAKHKIDFNTLFNNPTAFNNKFQPLVNKGTYPNLDFTSSSFWVKFSISNNASLPADFYLEVARPLTNKANLYSIINGNKILISKNGDELPFLNKEIKHRKIIFPIHFEPLQKIDFYLNLTSDGEALSLPLNLWKKQEFAARDYSENLILGIYYGVLLFAFIIYFFFFIVLKDKTYLYYISLIFSLFFLQLSLDGFAFQYLWPTNTWMASHSLILFASLSFFLIMVYTRSFLKIKERNISIKNIYNALITLALIGAISTFTFGKTYTYTYPYINIVSLLGLFLVFYAIIKLRTSGYHVCPYFISAFVFSVLGISLFILGQFSVIPQNIYTEHGIKLGSGLEVLFLSISMANKYRELQKEKEDAKNETLRNLEEMNKLKDDINTELEQKVKNRTKELNIQKEILAEKNDEIVSSIRYAKRIQNAILPPDSYINNIFENCFILYKPKDIVAGDFYWIEAISSLKGGLKVDDYHPSNSTHGENLVLFAAADCTGHGVPGAMVSVVCNNALNRAVREFNLTEPGKILDKTREIIVQEFEKSDEDVKDGMDISLCKLEFLDKEKSKLEWAGANNPLWIIRNNNILEYKPNKQPIGQIDNPQPFTTHYIDVLKNDTIYIFTDGYQDQFGGENRPTGLPADRPGKLGGKKFKASKLKELLLSIQHKTLKEQREIISQTFEAWKGNLEQIDDVCIIGVKI
jgi:serine phosphatase RsbU (regulator of sigma subunit)